MADDVARDPRLAEYVALLARLEAGDLDSRFAKPTDSPEPKDEIALLGESIVAAASSLSARFERERKFVDVSRDVAEGVYLDEVLDHIYESFRPLIPYDRIGCALLEDDNAIARARWGRSDGHVMQLKPGFSAPMAGSSLQPVIDTKKPRIINDLAEYGASHPDSTATKLILAEDIRSSLTCPLIVMGEPIGFLFFSSTTVGCYNSVHQQTFLRLADLVSVSVQKALLYEQIARLNQDLTTAQARLLLQATHDSLTGLLNHKAIIEELAALTDRDAARPADGSHSVGVIMFDIDHFKLVNDNFGHPAGDRVLSSVASRLASHLRSSDRIGRYGGEEFLAVIEVGDESDALLVAEQLRSSIAANPVTFGAKSIPVTISAGVAVPRPGSPEDSTTLIGRADRALYQAKEAGRNRVVVADFDTR